MTDPQHDAPTQAPEGSETVAPVPAPRSGRRRRTAKSGSFWRELPVLVVIAIVLAVTIKTFLVQAFFIPSGSMERTLLINDRVLVNKLVYDFRDPRRGEIVVFNGSKACAGTPAGPPGSCRWPELDAGEGTRSRTGGIGGFIRTLQSYVGLGSRGQHDIVKRVIAVAGDTVSCPGSVAAPTVCAHVVVNGVPLQESGYVYDDNHAIFAPVTVPRGDLWVMGDHRGNSSDSRANGTVAVSSVVGRAFVTVWPLGRIGGHSIPNDFKRVPANH